jgi:Short C-terminal domain
MGLIGGMARTAVVAGTATAVSNRVSRRQYDRWAQQGQGQQGYMPPGYYGGVAPPAAAPPAPAPSAGPDPIAQLKELASLKDQGILTEEEFAAQKARILG